MKISKVRVRYIIQLVLRIFIFIACALLYIFSPDSFDILDGMSFFSKFSVLHLIWLIWMFDMISQLIPVKDKISLGSQKIFKLHFKPITEKLNVAALRTYIETTTRAAYKVFVIWCALLLVLAVLYYLGIIGNVALFFISTAFYVCDLICVLIWCPFRLLMKTRCCTPCRIFNWDHLMMFSPMMFIRGFFPKTLFIFSLVIWLIWELVVMVYPERFWEYSNEALKCSNCTDKLCTQYCQKLRKKEK